MNVLTVIAVIIAIMLLYVISLLSKIERSVRGQMEVLNEVGSSLCEISEETETIRTILGKVHGN